jgi:hypothetical protein
LTDVLSDASYDRDGDEMASLGLYVELGPWSYSFFKYQLTEQSITISRAASMVEL